MFFDEQILRYRLEHVPVFLCAPSSDNENCFREQFHSITLDVFALIRDVSDCSPHTIVSSIGSGISLAEFAIIWTRTRANKIKQQQQNKRARQE